MAFEIPYDLINQVQILLRKESNLESYDPDDPSIPNLPSLEDSISELDPSPPYLRCKHCKGKLLSGLQSVICVFCGKEQNREVPPEPINFRSTCGYRWLLESLNLDGSEMVEPSAEANESNRGRSTPQGEISVSDLLDLEIKWIAEPEKIGAAVTSEASVQIKSSLNLVGVDLDNFFSEAKRDTASTASDENFVLSKQLDWTESNAVQGHGNLSLFENVQPSETAVRPTKDESGDSFSGWDAEFQSTGSGTFREVSKSFDPSVGSTVDLSAHMDTVFGPGKDSIDGKAKDDTVPSASNTNDWFQDDLWSNSNPGEAGQAEQFKMTKNVKASGMLDNANNTSCTKVDLIQDDQWQTSSNKAPDIKTVDEDDSFDSWIDSAQDPPNNPWKQTTSAEQSSDINLFSSTNNLKEVDFGSFSQPEVFPGVSSNQNSSAEGNNLLAEASVSERIADTNAKDGGNAEEVLKGEDVYEATSKSKADDVKILMSKMHDLSFMLEGNLSIPPKS